MAKVRPFSSFLLAANHYSVYFVSIHVSPKKLKMHYLKRIAALNAKQFQNLAREKDSDRQSISSRQF